MIKSITKLAAVSLLALSLAACTTGPRSAETTAPSAATSSAAPNGTIASGEPNGSATTAPTRTTTSKPVLTPPASTPAYQQQAAVPAGSAKGQAYIKRIKSDVPRLAAKSTNNTGLVRNGANLCSYISLIKSTQKRTPSAAEEADFVVRFYDGGQDKVSKTEAQAVVKATLDTICPQYK